LFPYLTLTPSALMLLIRIYLPTNKAPYFKEKLLPTPPKDSLPSRILFGRVAEQRQGKRGRRGLMGGLCLSSWKALRDKDYQWL